MCPTAIKRRLNAGFGLTNTDWTNGDADSDGDVDGYDFLQWQREHGAGQAMAVASSVQVPEPSALGILATLLLICKTISLCKSFRLLQSAI
jgi:hypothetical protein